MWYEVLRKFQAVMFALVVGLFGVALGGCEDEPDNGVLIQEDNGVEADVDAPDDNDTDVDLDIDD